jgi:hypothetical protein
MQCRTLSNQCIAFVENRLVLRFGIDIALIALAMIV